MQTIKGVLLSVFSTFLFACLYYFAVLLHPLTGSQIFGWRTMLTLPFITIFLVGARQWGLVLDVASRVRRRPLLVVGVLVSSILVGVQQWLFMWAPVNGRALQVSLGYFLLPLTMLLVGRFIYGERLSKTQKLATALAIAGVANQLVSNGAFSWEALVVCIGFPCYFVLRKWMGTATLGGLWFDMALTLPAACWLVLGVNTADQNAAMVWDPRLVLLLGVMAMMSAAAFMTYTMASSLLSFSLFGLLGYVEPVLMLIVSLLLGERIGNTEWLTYGPIWAAIAVLVAAGACHLRDKQRSG